MRAAICVARDGKTYRLVWFNESAGGVFLGSYGASRDVHFSYHADGKKHFRDAAETAPHGGAQEVAIVDFRGQRQLVHMSLPLAGGWFGPATECRAETKTELVVMVSDDGLAERDTLAVDLFLVHRDSEELFLQDLHRLSAGGPSFALVSCVLVSLDEFPDHRAALVLWGATIRSG